MQRAWVSSTFNDQVSRGTECLAWWACQAIGKEVCSHNAQQAIEHWSTVKIPKLMVDRRVDGQNANLVPGNEVL